ncbi:hypothetical protein SALBM311S_04779 [Streptomyces alboniger]
MAEATCAFGIVARVVDHPGVPRGSRGAQPACGNSAMTSPRRRAPRSCLPSRGAAALRARSGCRSRRTAGSWCGSARVSCTIRRRAVPAAAAGRGAGGSPDAAAPPRRATGPPEWTTYTLPAQLLRLTAVAPRSVDTSTLWEWVVHLLRADLGSPLRSRASPRIRTVPPGSLTCDHTRSERGSRRQSHPPSSGSVPHAGGRLLVDDPVDDPLLDPCRGVRVHRLWPRWSRAAAWQ